MDAMTDRKPGNITMALAELSEATGVLEERLRHLGEHVSPYRISRDSVPGDPSRATEEKRARSEMSPLAQEILSRAHHIQRLDRLVRSLMDEIEL